MNNIYPTSPTKNIKTNCRNCQCFTELEGEMLCYQQGKIIRLTPTHAHSGESVTQCNFWQARE